jgi:hypothetical protein
MKTIKLYNFYSETLSYLDYKLYLNERINFCKVFYGVESERWKFEYFDFPKKLGGSHIPCILFRDEEDAIIFKLKFGL